MSSIYVLSSFAHRYPALVAGREPYWVREWRNRPYDRKPLSNRERKQQEKNARKRAKEKAQ